MEENDDTTWIGLTPVGYARIDNDPGFGVWLYVEGKDEGYGPFDDEQAAENQLWELIDAPTILVDFGGLLVEVDKVPPKVVEFGGVLWEV